MKGEAMNQFNLSCQVCAQAAIAICTDCETPLCTVHAPASGQRCSDCELALRPSLLRPLYTPFIILAVVVLLYGLRTWKDEYSSFMAVRSAGDFQLNVLVILVFGGIFVWNSIAVGLRYAERRRLRADVHEH